MWAPSVLSREQVDLLSRLWFEALTGICAHVGSGGGGLHSVGCRPAAADPGQVDELTQQYRIADVLPLTRLQKDCSSSPASPTMPGPSGTTSTRCNWR